MKCKNCGEPIAFITIPGFQNGTLMWRHAGTSFLSCKNHKAKQPIFRNTPSPDNPQAEPFIEFEFVKEILARYEDR
jgi:hypothetical protein